MVPNSVSHCRAEPFKVLAAAPRPCKRGRFRVAISDTPFEPLCDSIRTCVAASRLWCSTRSYSIYRPILRYYDGTSGRGMDRVPVRLCSTECGCVYMCVYVCICVGGGVNLPWCRTVAGRGAPEVALVLLWHPRLRRTTVLFHHCRCRHRRRHQRESPGILRLTLL